MNKYRTSFIILFIFFAGFVASCSAPRKVVTHVPAPVKEAKEEKKEMVDEIFFNLKKHELNYQTLSLNFSAIFIENNKKTSLKGQCRMVKDSAIWISISPALGIEMVRILITPDSIKLMNRIEKTYFISDFQYINSFINNAVDFDMLQSLIIGNDLSYYENDKFKAEIDNQEYKLSTIGRQKLKKYIRHENEALIVLVQNLWLDLENFKIKKLSLKEIKSENKKMEAEYSSFVLSGEQLFPSKVKYHLDAEKLIDIEVNYTKVRVNDHPGISFRIPESYEPVN